jgi:hypothetical protein
MLTLCLLPDTGGSEGSFVSAKAAYLRATDGDSVALREAESLFAALMSANPENPVYTAYHGSLQVLQSARTMAPWKKGRLAKNGLSALDAAVSRAPDNLEVRFLRAISTVPLPGFFHRADQCAADFAWLAVRVEAAAESAAFDRRYGASALYQHGRFLARLGRHQAAVDAWKGAVRLAPESRGGNEARKRLSSQ